MQGQHGWRWKGEEVKQEGVWGLEGSEGDGRE